MVRARNDYALLLLCSLAALVAALGCTARPHAGSLPPPKPSIRVSPAAIDFGTVPSHTEAKATLAIENAGPGTLHFGSGSTKADGSLDWRAELPAVVPVGPYQLEFHTGINLLDGLPPGARVDFTVRLTASVAGDPLAAVRILTDDPKTPQINLPLSATVFDADWSPCSLTVTPADVKLPDTSLRRQTAAKLTVEVANLPARSCIFSAAFAPSGATGFSLSGLPAQPFWLMAREKKQFSLAFTPSAAGDFHTTLDFRTGSAQDLSRSVPVRVHVEEECLKPEPAALDFNTGEGCGWDSLTVQLTNTCKSTITIDGLSIDPDSYFAFVQRPVVPYELEAGRHVTLGVGSVWAKGTVAPSGQVSVSSPAGIFDIPLRGVTFQESLERDSAKQVDEATQLLDVLLVVDASLSMQDVEGRVWQQLVDYFTAIYDRAKLDFHVAVTTSSVNSTNGGSGSETDAANGRFLPLSGGGSPRVITRSTPNAQQVFASRIGSISATSTQSEYLLRAMELALSQPLVNTTNAGFLRSDAMLHVILVTDGDDKGTDTVNHYANFLAGLKSTSWRLRAMAVAGFGPDAPSGCTYDPNGNAGQRVAQLVHAGTYGGDTWDFCKEAWGNGLGHALPVRTPPLETRFYLSSYPYLLAEDPLRVFVNGQRMAGGWRYVFEYNAIEFGSENTAPDYGSSIDIEYSAYCKGYRPPAN